MMKGKQSKCAIISHTCAALPAFLSQTRNLPLTFQSIAYIYKNIWSLSITKSLLQHHGGLSISSLLSHLLMDFCCPICSSLTFNSLILMSQVVEFKVRLHCKACEKAVRKSLLKINGTSNTLLDSN